MGWVVYSAVLLIVLAVIVGCQLRHRAAIRWHFQYGPGRNPLGMLGSRRCIKVEVEVGDDRL